MLLGYQVEVLLGHLVLLLGCSYGPSEVFCGALGVLLGCFGIFLGPFSVFLGCSWDTWVVLGCFSGALGVLLGVRGSPSGGLVFVVFDVGIEVVLPKEVF